MRAVAIVCVGLMAIGGLAACQKKAGEAAKTGEAPQASANSPAAPLAPPKRKPGLWLQTMHTAGMTQVMKICLDNDTEAKMSLWGQAMGKSQCAKNAVTPVPGGWKFESVCDMGESGTITSTGAATGDFNSAYTVKVSSVTTGSSMPKANGAHEMSMDVVYQGPCPAGMKGGDVNVNGMTLNMEQMTARK